MQLLGRIRAAADRVTARLTLVGADRHDDEDLRARKALLVLISVLILPVAALWGALFVPCGELVEDLEHRVILRRRGESAAKVAPDSQRAGAVPSGAVLRANKRLSLNGAATHPFRIPWRYCRIPL
jgi:hypothetical protein